MKYIEGFILFYLNNIPNTYKYIWKEKNKENISEERKNSKENKQLYIEKYKNTQKYYI